MDMKRVTKPTSEHLLGFLAKYKELLELEKPQTRVYP